ncbi:MAG: hypothetical protein ACI3XQ_11185, partial [Eubacteriales bacterium]
YYSEVNDKCEIYGQTYFLASSFLMDKISAAMVMWYNVDIGNSLHIPLDELYDCVMKNEWTLEKLNQYSALTAGSENYGMVSSWHGVRALMIGENTPFVTVTEEGDVELTYYNEHLESVFSKVYAFINNNDYVFASRDNEGLGMFTSAKSLFAASYVGFMSSGENMNTEIDYTLLPIPKYDLDQENYITDVQRWDLVSVMKVADADRACIVLDALSYYSLEGVIPTYWDTLLGYRFGRDEFVPKILDIVRNTITFDFSAIYQTQMYAVYSGKRSTTELIFSESNTIASWWDEYDEAIEDRLSSLLIQYYELSRLN